MLRLSVVFQVNELQPGKYFGELGLVNHAPRQATVVARDDVRVACEYFLIKQIVAHITYYCLLLASQGKIINENYIFVALPQSDYK